MKWERTVAYQPHTGAPQEAAQRGEGVVVGLLLHTQLPGMRGRVGGVLFISGQLVSGPAQGG